MLSLHAINKHINQKIHYHAKRVCRCSDVYHVFNQIFLELMNAMNSQPTSETRSLQLDPT